MNIHWCTQINTNKTDDTVKRYFTALSIRTWAILIENFSEKLTVDHKHDFLWRRSEWKLRMAVIVDDVAVVEESGERDLFYFDIPNGGASVKYFVL